MTVWLLTESDCFFFLSFPQSEYFVVFIAYLSYDFLLHFSSSINTWHLRVASMAFTRVIRVVRVIRVIRVIRVRVVRVIRVIGIIRLGLLGLLGLLG